MEINEKIIFYNDNRQCIHPVIKSNKITKPKWRRIYWSTGRDSDEYKAKCVDLLETEFPELFQELMKQ